MITDALLTFSDDQAETTVAAHDSDGIIDYGAAVDWSQGRPLMLEVKIGDAVTSGGAATVAFELQDSADGSTFAAITPMPIAVAATAKATLVAGYTVMKVPLPVGIRRYLKMVYTIGTAVLTGGTFHARIDVE